MAGRDIEFGKYYIINEDVFLKIIAE